MIAASIGYSSNEQGYYLLTIQHQQFICHSPEHSACVLNSITGECQGILSSDNELFEISIYTPLIAYLMYPKTNNLFVLKTTNTKTSSYMGSNAFGAKVAIKKYEAHIYGVHVIGESLSYDLHLPMSISDAKKYKDSLSVLLICKPYIENNTLAFMGSIYHEPTFGEPYEINDSVSALNVELLEIWIYDFKTGKIFHKQSYM